VFGGLEPLLQVCGRLADYLGISRQEAMRKFFHNGKESIADEEVSLTPP
jgi:hypothetical protein